MLHYWDVDLNFDISVIFQRKKNHKAQASQGSTLTKKKIEFTSFPIASTTRQVKYTTSKRSWNPVDKLVSTNHERE